MSVLWLLDTVPYRNNKLQKQRENLHLFLTFPIFHMYYTWKRMVDDYSTV